MSNKPFDYIIVGAGTAGCIVANRLSASGKHAILLLEAGGKDRNPWIAIPAGLSRLLAIPRLLWKNDTLATPEFGGRSIPLIQGKLLGGSSSINGMIYVRGQKEDYDNWAELGCDGWSWQDVLPYFKKSECLESGGSDEFHGRSGEMKLSWMTTMHKIVKAFLQAALDHGLPFNDDINDGNQDGVGHLLGCVYKGRRQSTANTFLKAARKRPNLTTRVTSPVKRIVFEGEHAVGVELTNDRGESSVVNCNREVIVCAGGLASPLILQRSGVGDAEHLKSLGIEPVVNLPEVGKNLQDHLFAHLMFKLKSPSDSLNALLSNTPKMGIEAFKWLFTGKGWLNVTSSHLTSFFKSSADVERADIQMSMRPFSFDMRPDGSPDLHKFPGMAVSAIQTRPFSRGEVKITSADPRKDPLINPAYLSDPRDIEVLTRGMRQIRQLMSQPAIDSRVVDELEPGTDCVSDEAFEQYLRKHCETVYHPVGTCRMGSDKASVLDPRLRVRGVTGLRVVDASVMPVICSGNTVAASMMIGEKGSDLVLEDAT